MRRCGHSKRSLSKERNTVRGLVLIWHKTVLEQDEMIKKLRQHMSMTYIIKDILSVDEVKNLLVG